MTPLRSHVFDVAFSIEAACEHSHIPTFMLLAALEQRLIALRQMPRTEAREALGWVDSSEAERHGS
jgi:hypothetical protein